MDNKICCKYSLYLLINKFFANNCSGKIENLPKITEICQLPVSGGAVNLKMPASVGKQGDSLFARQSLPLRRAKKKLKKYLSFLAIVLIILIPLSLSFNKKRSEFLND